MDCPAGCVYSVLSLLAALAFLLPCLKQLDDGVLHLQGRIGFWKYLRMRSPSKVRLNFSGFFSSDMIASILSSLSRPAWLNFFIRWAWESDGVACS